MNVKVMIKNFIFPKNTHNTITSIALVILRIAFAGMLAIHGWGKLSNFEVTAQMFAPMGGTIAAVLAIFAEFFCALGVVVGLLYKLALIPMIINMSVAFFIAHGAKLTGEQNGEMAFLYLIVFVVLILTGPGKFALDNILSKFINKE